MGFYTVVLINNDRWSDITRNPAEFVKNISEDSYSLKSERHRKLRSGRVLLCQHADISTLLLVGGLQANQIYSVYNGGKTDTEAMLKVLKDAADYLGFNLHKKPKKKLPAEPL